MVEDDIEDWVGVKLLSSLHCSTGLVTGLVVDNFQ